MEVARPAKVSTVDVFTSSSLALSYPEFWAACCSDFLGSLSVSLCLLSPSLYHVHPDISQAVKLQARESKSSLSRELKWRVASHELKAQHALSQLTCILASTRRTRTEPSAKSPPQRTAQLFSATCRMHSVLLLVSFVQAGSQSTADV